MARADGRAFRFVRALLAGDQAERQPDGRFALRDGDRQLTLPASIVRRLQASGVLAGDNVHCRATREARQWLRRQVLAADPGPFAAQHRTEIRTPAGTRLNLEESPLARLAVAARGATPFLASHQVEAGERVRQLAQRARLQPRVTMAYDGAPRAASGAAPGRAALSDLAIDARRALAELHRVLPPDCAGVVLDVCGLLKGLQTVEGERGWPRRSAKLVLRIGLEQLAQHYGLAPVAVGPESRRSRTWLADGARPRSFG